MATYIDGKKIAQTIIDQLSIEVNELKNKVGITPTLSVVLVGDDPASQIYVRNKIKRAHESGIATIEHKLDTKTTQAQLDKLIESLNNDNDIHGVLVQLPLPGHLDEGRLINAIDPNKDVDGFHPLNVGALHSGQPSFVPCTPQGCMHLLNSIHKDLSGKNALIVGRSNIVGKPMAALLLQANSTVTIAHSRTQNIRELCLNSDILVSAVGQPKMIQGNWIKPGATVIDVGINTIKENNKNILVGDIDFTSSEKVAGAITPVPGGVGPMTIACLMLNTLKAAKMSKSG